MREAVLLLVLLGAMSGREALQLIHLPATSNMAENSSPETSVHKFSVKLSVSLSPVTPGFPPIINSNPLTQAFMVNTLSKITFEVVTTGNEQLDFETGPGVFDLQIYVKDDVRVTDLQVLTVQVTDVNEPPQFLGSLAKVFSDFSHLKSFSMSANGTLFSTTEFDFEAGPNSYQLDVEVRDSEGLGASTQLRVNIVTINDEIPRFISPAQKYVVLDELVLGTIVANITAEDPDDQGLPGFLLYSITTANSSFMINQLTGPIQVAHRLDRDAGELRQNPVISLEVLVKDRPFGGQENHMQITFLVEDINDNLATCTRLTFSIMVPERAANGTLLLDLNTVCFDNDSEAPSRQFNFTAPSGVGRRGRFLQDPAGSGKIVLAGDLDYENSRNLAAGNKYTMTVQVQDVAPHYKKNIYIYVLTSPENEFPLVFDQPSYVFGVLERSPPKISLGAVKTADRDFPQGGVMYSISSGGASLQYPNVLWIHPQTGELQLVTQVDYETTPSYTLRIQATNEENTGSVTVTVNILEENDEKPSCSPNSSFLAVPVDLKAGTNIRNFKRMCTDRDSSPRSFRYAIGSGNINNHFTFSLNAGSNVTRLLLATRFDYATGPLDKIWDYNLLVYITDDNLLSGRRKAEALVETRTVTLSIRVIPHPTTIATTTPPGITYQILRENIYSPSAWYVPFVITWGSILLLVLLVALIIQSAKAMRRHCPCKTGEHRKPLPYRSEDYKERSDGGNNPDEHSLQWRSHRPSYWSKI